MNLTAVNNTVTMSSLELVDFINSQRKEGEAVLRHDHFMAKVPKVLGETAPKFLGTDIYVSGNGATSTRNIYNFPKREACLMAMSYSYELQAKVYDRMTTLEEQRNVASLPDFTNPVIAARAWADAEEGRLIAEKNLEEAKPAIGFYDAIGDSTSLTSVGDAAKSLGFGRNHFFKWLRSKEFLMKDYNTPYQKWIEAKYFQVKYQSYVDEFGEIKHRPVTFITGKGLQYLQKQLD